MVHSIEGLTSVRPDQPTNSTYPTTVNSGTLSIHLVAAHMPTATRNLLVPSQVNLCEYHSVGELRLRGCTLHTRRPSAGRVQPSEILAHVTGQLGQVAFVTAQERELAEEAVGCAVEVWLGRVGQSCDADRGLAGGCGCGSGEPRDGVDVAVEGALGLLALAQASLFLEQALAHFQYALGRHYACRGVDGLVARLIACLVVEAMRFLRLLLGCSGGVQVVIVAQKGLGFLSTSQNK